MGGASNESVASPLDEATLAARRKFINEIMNNELRFKARIDLALDLWNQDRDDTKATDPEKWEARKKPSRLQLSLDLTRHTVFGEIGRLCDLVDKLATRIGELEARPELKYCGVFEAKGAPYRPGEFVTHGGSIWHCWTETSEMPGSSDAWQLAVKRGTNGRDAHG